MWYEVIMDVNDLRLTNKVAVVTGAARGIGKATALAFADLGAHVAVCDMLDDEASMKYIVEAGNDRNRLSVGQLLPDRLEAAKAILQY